MLEKAAESAGGRADLTVVSHSADRLVRAFVVATASPSDLRTLAAWGQSVGVSRGALRVWCKAARLPARSCLDFVRVLRAVILFENRTWDLFSTLDIVDERSLVRLLDRGGVRELATCTTPPSVEDFLSGQRFLKNPQLVQALLHRLNQDRR